MSLNGIGISSDLLEEIERQAGKKFEPRKQAHWVEDTTSQRGFNKADSIVPGIQISFVNDLVARAIVRENLSAFQQAGYYIYLTNLRFDKLYWNSHYDIAVIKCRNQFELVKLIGTSGVNYDVTNEEVVKTLELWHRASPFLIIGADEDMIEADFLKLPADLNKFAEAVANFCPDVIEQGAGSQKALVEHFESKKAFWLWWD